MAQLFKNNAFSALAASLTNVATTLTVTTGHGDRFPAVSGSDFFMLTLQDASNNVEIVKVTARTAGADAMTIVRAQEGFTARAWNLGDVVELRLTQFALNPLSVFAGAATAQAMRDAMATPSRTGDDASGTWAINISGNAATATNAANAAAVTNGVYTAGDQSIDGVKTFLKTIQGTISHPFPSGTRMPFAQASAPTGWTQDTSDNADNRMLRVVNTAGGGVAGTHSPILNNVVPAHTHGFTTGNVSNDHAHYVSGGTSGEGNHAHYVAGDGGGSNTSGLYGTANGGPYGGRWTSDAGYHSHSWGGWTGGINSNHTHSGSTNNGSSQTNWQPRYIDLIICTKN